MKQKAPTSRHPWALYFGNQDNRKQSKDWSTEQYFKKKVSVIEDKWTLQMIRLSNIKVQVQRFKADSFPEQAVIAPVKWMKRQACGMKGKTLSADRDDSAHCINSSKTTAPAARGRAARARTSCSLPGNLKFKTRRVCVCSTCARAGVTRSPLCLFPSLKLHFLFHNSEHLLDDFLKCTRPPRPCQSSARSVRQAGVLSDWLHFEPPPPFPVFHFATSPTWLSRNAYVMGQNVIIHRGCCVSSLAKNPEHILIISLEPIQIGMRARRGDSYITCCRWWFRVAH